MRLGWKQRYEIGIPSIDEQHKNLLELINRLNSTNSAEFNNKKIFALLNTLVQYAEKHFSSEERIMEFTRYPKFSEHRTQHEKFLATIHTFAEKLENSNPNIPRDLFLFLKEWYIAHIGGTDQEYKSYFQNHRPELFQKQQERK